MVNYSRWLAMNDAAHADKFLFNIAAGVAWRWVRSPASVRALWLINCAVFCGLVLWILSDGQFAMATVMLRNRIAAARDLGPSASAYTWYAGRILALAIVGVLAAASAVGIFLGLFFGATAHRRVRSWFAFTLLLAAWLMLFVSWQEIAWRGQAFRLHHRLDGFETIAESLRAEWPAIDGDRPQMGPFMAYPIGQPTMIMMLKTAAVPGTRTSFASVERGDDGSLRFELIGDEPDAWLEWHPTGSVPQSFVGGLGNEYQLERYAPLRQGWFLARYQ
jgi:hypothetical protein